MGTGPRAAFGRPEAAPGPYPDHPRTASGPLRDLNIIGFIRARYRADRGNSATRPTPAPAPSAPTFPIIFNPPRARLKSIPDLPTIPARSDRRPAPCQDSKGPRAHPPVYLPTTPCQSPEVRVQTEEHTERKSIQSIQTSRLRRDTHEWVLLRLEDTHEGSLYALGRSLDCRLQSQTRARVKGVGLWGAGRVGK